MIVAPESSGSRHPPPRSGHTPFPTPHDPAPATIAARPSSEDRLSLSYHTMNVIHPFRHAALAIGLLCLYAPLAAQDQQPELENLGPNVNTEAQENAPVLSPDGRTLYFQRTMPAAQRYGCAMARPRNRSARPRMRGNSQYVAPMNVSATVDVDPLTGMPLASGLLVTLSPAQPG